MPASDTGYRHPTLSGIRDMLPLLVGVAPFGFLFGLLGRTTDLGPWGTQAMSALVYAGSAQFIAVGLLNTSTPATVIVLTTFIINLRHFLYSASLSPYLQRVPLRWKRLLAYVLTDEAFALLIVRLPYITDPSARRAYFLGSTLAMYVCWQLSTALGIFLGGSVPDPTRFGLDFVPPLAFIGLLTAHEWGGASVVTAVVAGVVVLAASPLPWRLGILLAALVGAVAGVWVEGKAGDRKDGG